MGKIKLTKNFKISLLILIILSGILLFSQSHSSNKIRAQSNNVSIADIQDRYVLLNWSVPDNSLFNGFRIDYRNETGFNHTWSFIFLNQSVEREENYFSPVNYTISDSNLLAQKKITLNFTVYIVSNESDAIHARITGLLPSQLYQFSIYLVNATFVDYTDMQIIQQVSEELYWESEQVETLQSQEDQLHYSKLATSLSLLVIVILFVAIFIFFARRDVPFNRIAYVFIFPALFALVLLEVYPILYGIFLSFTSYNLVRGEQPVFTGFNNYAHITENPQLPIAFTTTLVWTTLIILVKIVLGFILAYIIQYKVKRKKLWYLFLYIPWAIPSYIKILSWRTFFHGTGGISFFNALFGTNVNLLTQPYVALFIACFVEVWDSIPLITTLFLAGLSSIPRELNDIADIDQIRERTKIRKIVIPLIKPIILPAIILEIIKTFGSFNVAFLLTNGYPLLSYGSNEAGIIGATDLFSTFTFYMFYQQREIGIAAAYSTIMSLLTLFFVLIWVKMSKGTKSSYIPSSQKKTSTNKYVLPILFLFQSAGYLASSLTEFRYFGIYWNDVLSYVFAGFYLVSAILIFSKKNISIKLFKLMLIADITLSLSQFFFYQMWYALNWNIFIIVLEFFIISNIRKNSSEEVEFKPIKSIIIWCRQIKRSVGIFLQKLDSKTVNLNSIHGILLIQFTTILTANILLKLTNWLPWTILALFGVYILASCVSEFFVKVSILLQPILWTGIIISWNLVGWVTTISLLSFTFVLNYLRIHTQFNFKQNKFLSKTYEITSKPKNSIFFLFLVTAVALIPFWNIIWIAFSRGNSSVPTSFFPDNPTLDNFRRLFTQESIHLNFANSLLIALGSASICVILTALAAYGFSRYTFKAKKEMMVGVFTLKMFTGILTLIPFYLIMFNLGLIDTYIGAILAFSTHTIPLALWIIKGYIDSIPKELDESAMVMGNSRFRVLRKIILPLSGPAIAITFLLNFLSTWNGFLMAFVLLQSPGKYTLPIKLYTFLGSIESSSPEWGLFAAASILVTIPLLLVFVFLRNYLLKGIDNSVNIRDV